MKHFIHNNKGILSLWLVLALFFSLMPSQAMGMGKETVSGRAISGSSQQNFEVSTGSAIKVNKVTITTGSSLVYNGKEQNPLIKEPVVELGEENDNLTKNDIKINWRTESLGQKFLEQPNPPSCPPLDEEEWKEGNKFNTDISPIVNAGDTALYCRAVDKNNDMIATGSAVVRIEKCSVKLMWTNKLGASFQSGDRLPYNGENQAPYVKIENSKTYEMTQKDHCDLKTEIILEDAPKEILKTSKAVGNYRVTASLSGDKKDNYEIEGEQSYDYTIVPTLKKNIKNVDFIWGKKWKVKKDLKKLISCDDAALSKITLSVKTKKRYIQENKNRKYIEVGKKKWKRKITSNTSISFTAELTEVDWTEKLKGVIKFPGFSKVKKIVKRNRKRKGKECKYVFKYSIKRKFAKRILVKIDGVKKNKAKINKALEKYVKGCKSNGKESYLILTYPSVKKAKKSSVFFNIWILYDKKGENHSKMQRVKCYEKNNKPKVKVIS